MQWQRIVGVLGVFVWGLVVLMVTSLWLLLRPPLASTGDVAAFTDALETLVAEQMTAHAVNDVGIGLVHEGEVVQTVGYGAVDPQTTHFQIASLSKPLAAWGVMALVEAGEIALDTPVQTRLNGWTFPDSEYDPSQVTVAHLLSHTAGVNIDGYEGFPPDQTPQTLRESLDGAADTPDNAALTLITAPGSAYAYSGGGYSVLQLLVESVSGESFADYMQAQIFSPLNMADTRYSRPDEIVPVYDAAGDAQPPRTVTALAAGGAYSTVADMSRWVAELAQPSGVALDQTTVQQMRQPQPNAVPGVGVRYGLGYYLERTLRRDVQVVWHDGNNLPGWRTYAGAVPAQESGIVVLTNTPGGAALHQAVECAWVRWTTDDLTPQCILRAADAAFPVAFGAWLAGIVLMGAVLLWRGRSDK